MCVVSNWVVDSVKSTSITVRKTEIPFHPGIYIVQRLRHALAALGGGIRVAKRANVHYGQGG